MAKRKNTILSLNSLAMFIEVLNMPNTQYDDIDSDVIATGVYLDIRQALNMGTIELEQVALIKENAAKLLSNKRMFKDSPCLAEVIRAIWIAAHNAIDEKTQ